MLKRQLQEKLLEEEREAWEAQLVELLKERLKRHNSLRKSLPEGSTDVTELQVKALLKRIRCGWRPPSQKGTGYSLGAPTQRPDVGATLRDTRQSALGGPTGTETDSERE